MRAFTESSEQTQNAQTVILQKCFDGSQHLLPFQTFDLTKIVRASCSTFTSVTKDCLGVGDNIAVQAKLRVCSGGASAPGSPRNGSQFQDGGNGT
ncbi:hypothetical protein [Pseudoduganella sp. R-34]|uniref:hypothetical protein n=1 Tax=Pseudoduganella sp. R-34 TaxID=3404062 RepID=UPI003CF462D7